MYEDKTRYFHITVYTRSAIATDDPVDGVHYERWFYVDACFYMVGKFHRSVNMSSRYDAIANVAMNHAIARGMSASAMKYINKRGSKRAKNVSDKQLGLF